MNALATRKVSVARSLFAGLLLMIGVFAGCESTDGGGSTSASVYYGAGYYDTWYHGGYYDDPDIIVTPPERPDRPISQPHPEHPIVRPPAPTPRPTPMPSIPSTPRVTPSVGGRR